MARHSVKDNVLGSNNSGALTARAVMPWAWQ
jgi:hypothetical protein